MKLKVFSQDGKQVGEASVSDDVFGGRVNTALLHQVLTAYRANQRQGTAKAKTRSEVSGGGAKPWKQKGTGRARSGSNTSPIWIRGAKAFGPRPRSYWSRIPKAVRLLALRHALSSRVQDDRMMVVESISVEPAKTRTVAAILKALPAVTGRTLLVTDGVDQTLYRCGKNIKNLAIVPVGFLNAAEVMRCEMVILGTKSLVDKIEKAVSA